ncbi:MAG: pseudouridine synthase, partial [Myxococcota bacterium]
MKLPADLRGERLDRAISTGLHRVGRPVSVREVRLALRAGRIRVDGQRRAPGLRAQGGEAVDVETFAARHEARIEGQPELLERVTVLETWPDLWALDKPTGLPCAPLRAEERDTLLHAAVALDPEVAQAGPPLEGGLCHRLDTGTSGAVLFARRTEARDRVRAWFGQHAVEKTYLARVASGAAEALPARVDRPIGPGP